MQAAYSKTIIAMTLGGAAIGSLYAYDPNTKTLNYRKVLTGAGIGILLGLVISIIDYQYRKAQKTKPEVLENRRVRPVQQVIEKEELIQIEEKGYTEECKRCKDMCEGANPQSICVVGCETVCGRKMLVKPGGGTSANCDCPVYYDPVCDKHGNRFDNPCLAKCKGVAENGLFRCSE